MTTATKTMTTSYAKNGMPAGVPADYSGELLVWGLDCVPDRFEVRDGKIVKTLFMSPGDWTRVR